jgi:hypothetical protein
MLILRLGKERNGRELFAKIVVFVSFTKPMTSYNSSGLRRLELRQTYCRQDWAVQRTYAQMSC